MEKTNLLELLNYINPSLCDYQDWVNVGMALKHEGYFCYDWERWSSKDSQRYHPGECEKKWESFQEGAGSLVTGGTIYQMAVDNGWSPPSFSKSGHELDWGDTIKKDMVVIEKGWVEGQEIQEPSDDQWNPIKDVTTYLEALFDAEEIVGYVTDSWQNESGKYLPNKGNYDRTCAQLIQDIKKYDGDLESVFGTPNEEAGAWVRFNPLDGKGVKNSNVTEFKYALVESDTMSLAQQNAMYRELELPIAALVYSGKKSVHAIVHIDAIDYAEYRKRVDFLYDVCKKNGIEIDKQNKNPSRLSRMPGFRRDGHKQFLIDTNIGKSSFIEWKEWIESVNDDLPDQESLADFWDNLPELAPPLINGILRQGHKMLIAGPSKAGKSFALIEMSIAIAEGSKWFGWNCAQGRVLYVNLELDRASCLHRFKDVYTELKIAPNNLQNIDIWNLRGKSVPMDKLAPKLIRRAAKKNYIAIIIDPIYKVITGDENSADQMAMFCNQFDKVCTELGCAVIYCHHHSKGAQGGKKSMDRASGSGVFARDPDALIDLIELETTDAMIEQQKNKAVCAVCQKWLDHYGYGNYPSLDDQCNSKEMLAICRQKLNNDTYETMLSEVQHARASAENKTAWRIEGTLREFPKFAPLNLWFDYPVHRVDHSGVLKDIQLDPGGGNTWKKNFTKKKSPEERKKERTESLKTAFSAVADNGKATLKELAEYMGVTEKTVRSRVKEVGGFWIDEGDVGEK